MASGTERWHSTSAIRDARVPRMQHGCRGAHCPSAPCLHGAACTHRSQRHVRTAYSGRYQNAAGLHTATGSVPYWLQALCVSHLCSHRKECWECGSHAADRRQSSPRGPHHTCGAVCRIAGANQRRTECRMASGTEQWHSTINPRCSCRECSTAAEVPIAQAHHAARNAGNSLKK